MELVLTAYVTHSAPGKLFADAHDQSTIDKLSRHGLKQSFTVNAPKTANLAEFHGQNCVITVKLTTRRFASTYQHNLGQPVIARKLTLIDIKVAE